MHEVSLMKSMVDILDEEIRSSEVGEVKIIHLEVGKLRYIVPEILVSCFERLPKNEKLKTARINLEILPVKLRCKKCFEETLPEGERFACCKCSSNDFDIIQGNEFRIKAIEW